MVHHGMEWHDWCLTIIQYEQQKWGWRVVGCISTPHQHSHQVKPLVLVVSHYLALLLIDRVVDVLSQSICVWMIHHRVSLLNATHVVMCVITTHVNQMAWCDHITVCASTHLFSFSHTKHGAVCVLSGHTMPFAYTYFVAWPITTTIP